MLSIIIPCLNEAESISGSLAALAPLRERGCEVIVVDGGSTDGTSDIAAPLADKVVASPRGRARQMNTGAAEARGDLLLFLHADCRLPPQADVLIVDGLNRARKTWGRFDVSISGTHPLFDIIGAMMNVRSRLTAIATGDQGIFVTRSLFEAAGCYPDIALMEDIALCKALKRYGKPLCLRHRIATSGRRWEKHGVLRTILLMWWLRLRYWMGANPDALTAHYAPHRSSGES